MRSAVFSLSELKCGFGFSLIPQKVIYLREAAVAHFMDYYGENKLSRTHTHTHTFRLSWLCASLCD